MRKAQKRQIEEIIRQMEEAHDEIKRCIEEGIAAQAAELLADCQNTAIAVGTLIENAEGEGHPAVTALENYCEQVYRVHENIEAEDINANKIYKALRQKLIKAENSIRNDVKIRTVAVFLPYKASMWDSLESVWKAADADPDCDAYVIPISYFDKNPDGSFKEEHYEGDQYPDYVPVTRYDAYDLEVEHPDVIYIHNPYDECNYVTSVHPQFYAKNLKNYTDKLVYIPYFVLGEIEPDNQAAIDGMKHFCFLPGTIYANQVIVQSENMRQIYINEYIKAAKQAGLDGEHVDRKFLEKKFLGTGSPKIDKVLNTKKEDLEIPQEWLKIIEKPDGSWKKIVFYNTSVGALLQHSEKMLAKMESVFGIFKEHKDEVALLWRPHPLIQATIESMRPQLWKKYKEIKDKYIEEGWGIYDDTSDIDRAVVLSDAYYGDGSSVIRLCREKGMPVMTQDVSFLQGDKTSLAMYNMVEYKGEWYFFAFKDNCIYKMNRTSFAIKKVVRIPLDEKMGGAFPQYGKIYIYHKKAFLIPWMTNRIVIYDFAQEKIRYIEYGQRDNRGEPFWDGVILGNALFLIPCAYESILKIDLITEEVSYLELDLDKGTPIEKRNYAWGSIYVDKTKIYFTKLLDNKILQVDLEDNSRQVYECRYLENGGAGICGDEKFVWIVPQKAEKILCWDKKKKELRIYDAFPEGYKSGEWSFCRIELCDEHLYLLPRDANMCIAINKENGKIWNLNFNDKENNSENFYDKYIRFSNIWKSKENVYIMNTNSGKVYCVNDYTLQIETEKELELLSTGKDNLEMDFILSGTEEEKNEA